MRALAPQQLRAALRRCDGAAAKRATKRTPLTPHARLTRAPTHAAAAARCAAPAPRRTVPRRTLAAAAGEGSAAAPPPLPDIPKLAAMARLDVTAEEAAAWSPKINAIVDWRVAARRTRARVRQRAQWRTPR